MTWVLGPLGQAAGDTPEIDWFGLLERFGLPTFLLVLILWTGWKGVWVWGSQLKTSATEVQKRDDRIAAQDAEIRGLRDAQLHREQQLVAGFGNRLYDAAVLYQQGTELVARAAPAAAASAASHDQHVGELVDGVKSLLERLGEPGVRGAGPDG